MAENFFRGKRLTGTLLAEICIFGVDLGINLLSAPHCYSYDPLFFVYRKGGFPNVGGILL